MTLRKITSVAAALTLFGTMTFAQDHGAMDHSAMAAHGGEGLYDEAMATMMTEMDSIEPTGDPDADFLLMMIPHHQSAVDMARTLLEQSDDAEVAALAEEIIATQEEEIAVMTAMLERLGYAPAE